MSPPGRPKGEYRSAQHEGCLICPPGRPKGEYRSAQHEGWLICPPGRLDAADHCPGSHGGRQTGWSRRQWLGAALGTVMPAAWATEPQLPQAHVLADHLGAALRRKEPLLVMVSLAGCPYCKIVRENYLAPMHREQGLQVVQVDMQSNQPLRDFRGATSTHARQIETWGIRIAPTVLFFGRDGAEVAARLVGGYLSDFYGAYLDQRLETARRALA